MCIKVYQVTKNSASNKFEKRNIYFTAKYLFLDYVKKYNIL